MSFKFNQDDPQMVDDTPLDFQGEGDVADVPEQVEGFEPPRDGVHRVFITLADPKAGDDGEAKMPVYVKGKGADKNLIASVRVRLAKLDEQSGEWIPGASLRPWYPMTKRRAAQSISSMAALCNLFGKPMQIGRTDAEHIQNVYDMFELGGEMGLQILVETEWHRSVPTLTKDGQQRVDKDGNKEYTETTTEFSVKRKNRLEAENIAKTTEWPDEETAQRWWDKMVKNPWLYIDPLSGEVRSAQAQVKGLVGKAE